MRFWEDLDWYVLVLKKLLLTHSNRLTAIRWNFLDRRNIFLWKDDTLEMELASAGTTRAVSELWIKEVGSL